MINRIVPIAYGVIVALVIWLSNTRPAIAKPIIIECGYPLRDGYKPFNRTYRIDDATKSWSVWNEEGQVWDELCSRKDSFSVVCRFDPDRFSLSQHTYKRIGNSMETIYRRTGVVDGSAGRGLCQTTLDPSQTASPNKF